MIIQNLSPCSPFQILTQICLWSEVDKVEIQESWWWSFESVQCCWESEELIVQLQDKSQQAVDPGRWVLQFHWKAGKSHVSRWKAIISRESSLSGGVTLDFFLFLQLTVWAHLHWQRQSALLTQLIHNLVLSIHTQNNVWEGFGHHSQSTHE